MASKQVKRDIYTTAQILNSNHDLINELKPVSAKKKYWLNQFLREKLMEELANKKESAT